MVQGTGDALEWALALAKAPAERIALRQRALPDGMVTVLQIATGVSGNALTEAVETTGEDEQDILEAARFYVREILFYRGADAYRMLGLTRDAASDTIRTHHRLLQQWLHPDRHTSDWDAIYASRVNAAWNQLRTKARRAEYDAKAPASPSDERNGPSLPMSVKLIPQAVVTSHASDRWRRRIPVLGLFAICGVLGLMALRDMQREPGSRLPERIDAETAPLQEDIGLTLHVPDPPVREKAEISAVLNPQRSESLAVAMPVPELLPPAALSRRQPEKELVPEVLPPARAKPPIPKALVATVVPTATKPIVDAKALRSTAQVAVVASSGIVGMQAVAKTSLPAQTFYSTPVSAPVVALRSPDVDAREALAIAPARASTQQVSQVQRTGQQLLVFMVRTSTNTKTPPIWDNTAIQAQALQLGTYLQEGGFVRAGEPNWRISGASAVMAVNLQAEQNVRRLRVELVWREQRWLVSGLSMEQAL